MRESRWPRPRPPRSPWRAAVTSVAALALLVPVAVPATLGVRTVLGFWDKAPAALPQVPLSSPSVILADDGKTTLATVYLYNRQPVTAAGISPLITTGLVSTEDARFYSNNGIDLKGITRALEVTLRGGAQQGGSTITQQFVKMSLAQAGVTLQDGELTAAATQDSAWRKLREAKLAMAVDRSLGKQDVLTGYLNLAYFGSGAYGVQAAAQRYFSVDATAVSLPQAALLVGLVNSPNRLDPIVNPAGALARRNLVLDRMLTAHAITPTQHDQAAASPLGLAPSVPANGCAAGPAPLFCDWVRAQLEDDPALGASAELRQARLAQGGLTITTTFDPAAQAATQAGLAQYVPSSGDVVATQVLVQPGTGNVTAMATTRPYGTGPGQSVMPLATVVAFQPGSTFKAFTLLAALEAHVPLSTRLPGGDRYTSSVFDNPSAGYYRNSGDGEGSNLSVQDATAHSVNTAFIQLEEKIGVAAVADAAHRAGLSSLDPASVAPREGALTLGTRETSVLQLADAYATIAAHGLACTPRGVLSIVTTDGTRLDQPGPDCTQQFTPAVADTVSALLTSVVAKGGTGENAAVAGHDIAGKTGTTQDFGAAWFAGFTSQAASAVWMGDPRGGPSHPLVNVLGQPQVYGGTIPAPIFSATFTRLLAGTPNTPLPAVNETYLATRSAR